MTPEEVERLRRLEGIFMPYATRQRRDAYFRQTSKEPEPGATLRFVHYTSASAAMSIINEKRIWMRDTNCMADYSEVQLGVIMLQEYFRPESPDRQNFMAALDNCSDGVAQEAIDLFNGWFQDTRLNTYITSVPEHDASEDLYGRLSMWRTFGGDAGRVAFVFKVPYLPTAAVALRVMFSPVSLLQNSAARTRACLTN